MATIGTFRQSQSSGFRPGSFIASALAMLILGITLLCASGIHHAAVKVRSQIGFVAVVDPSFGRQSIDSLKQALTQAPYIQTITGRTAEEVLSHWEELMGPEELLDINPFLPEFDITVKPDWAKPDSLESIALDLEGISCVDHVQIHTDTVSAVGQYIATWFLALSIAGLVVIAACVALISTATAMSLRSRLCELADRLLLGEKRCSIATSFAGKAVIWSIIASLTAIAGLAGMWAYTAFLDENVAIIIPPIRVITVAVALPILATVISGLSAYIWTWFKISSINNADND